MEAGEFALEIDMIGCCAGDVARAAGAHAYCVYGLVSRAQHGLVLALPQIVIRAPDDDLAGAAVGHAQAGVRKTAPVT